MAAGGYVMDTGILLQAQQVKPWMHESFAPLPAYLLQRLAGLNQLEMPPRKAFDDALNRFVSDLTPELQLTAAFPPKQYSELTQMLNEGKQKNLAPRLFVWTAVHHVQLGSQKVNRLVLLREQHFPTAAAERSRLRQTYVMHADRGENAPGARSDDELIAEWARPFERLPVQPQIFDVLSYSHRNHNSAASLLKECRRVGIVSLSNNIAALASIDENAIGKYYMAYSRNLCSPVPCL